MCAIGNRIEGVTWEIQPLVSPVPTDLPMPETPAPVVVEIPAVEELVTV